jgi:hypothetical protein
METLIKLGPGNFGVVLSEPSAGRYEIENQFDTDDEDVYDDFDEKEVNTSSPSTHESHISSTR